MRLMWIIVAVIGYVLVFSGAFLLGRSTTHHIEVINVKTTCVLDKDAYPPTFTCMRP